MKRRGRWMGAGVVTVLFLLVGEGVSASPLDSASDFPALQVFSAQSDVPVSVEGVVEWRDLRKVEASLNYRLAQAALFEVGRVVLSEPGSPLTELESVLTWLLEFAGPGEDPVPGAVVAFSRPGARGSLQILMKLSPGWEERLGGVTAKKGSAATLFLGKGGLHLEALGLRLFGGVNPEGWLILSTSDAGLRGGPPMEALFSPEMKKKLHAVDGFAMLEGRGFLGRYLGSMGEGAETPWWSRRLKGMALTWTAGGKGTRSCELLVEFLGAEALGDKSEKPGSGDWMLNSWDLDATDFLLVSLPEPVVPLLRAGGERWLNREFPTTSSTLARSLRGLGGRFGGAVFSSPRDWVLETRFESVGAASGFVRGTYELLRSEIAKGAGQGTLKLSFSGGQKGEPTLLGIQPDSGLRGVWLRAHGKRVKLVSQDARLRQLSLLEPLRKDVNKGARRSFMEGPASAEVKEVMNRPGFAKGYTVPGAPGVVWDLLSWGVGVGELVLDLPEENLRKTLRRYQGIEDHFPAQVKLLSLVWMLTYELAFSLRVDGGILVAQMVSSDI